MSCRICGRSVCTESFHSLKQQERFQKVCDLAENYSEHTLAGMILERDDEIEELKLAAKELNEMLKTHDISRII